MIDISRHKNRDKFDSHKEKGGIIWREQKKCVPLQCEEGAK